MRTIEDTDLKPIGLHFARKSRGIVVHVATVGEPLGQALCGTFPGSLHSGWSTSDLVLEASCSKCYERAVARLARKENGSDGDG